MDKGLVVWFTGPPSSGKSTLAALASDALRQEGINALVIEPYAFRRAVIPSRGWRREDIEAVFKGLLWVVRLLAFTGTVVFLPSVMPTRKLREMFREGLRGIPNVLVCVHASAEVCRQRDSKGIYSGSSGEASKVLELYKAPDPQECDIYINTEAYPVNDCVSIILTELKEKFL